MKKFLILILLVSFLFPKFSFAQTQKWFYPLPQIEKRATVKGFGDYIDENFYRTHLADQFPNHFYGYHAAVDLESLENEKIDSVNVPVYFVTSGTISYIGSLSGYGGVVLVKLDNTNETALYGHVRILGIKYSVGQHVEITSPTVLTYLGNGFSNQTSGERKHLHFGIYKGQDLYFHGHEPTMKILNTKWYNPLDYLSSKHAQKIESVSPTPTLTPIISENAKTKPSQNLVVKFVDFVRGILTFITSKF